MTFLPLPRRCCRSRYKSVVSAFVPRDAARRLKGYGTVYFACDTQRRRAAEEMKGHILEGEHVWHDLA